MMFTKKFSTVLMSSLFVSAFASTSGLADDSSTRLAEIEFKKYSIERDNKYTYSDAASANGYDSLKLGGGATISKLAAKGIQIGALQVLHESSSVPTRLTDEQIRSIMGTVRNSQGARFGFGTAGGAMIEITSDKGQVERMLAVQNLDETAKHLASAGGIKNASAELSGGALRKGPLGDIRGGSGPNVKAVAKGAEIAETMKPSMQAESVALRTTTFEGLEEQLKRIKASGAVVSRITFRSFTSRAAEKLLTGGSVVGAVFSVERLGAAALNGLERKGADYCDPKVFCDKPNRLKALITSAPGDAYEKQAGARAEWQKLENEAQVIRASGAR